MCSYGRMRYAGAQWVLQAKVVASSCVKFVRRVMPLAYYIRSKHPNRITPKQ